MAGFAAQPDEGYSEDPLNNGLSASASFLLKQREDAVLALASDRADFPAWLTQHISNLPAYRKTELAMAILNDLPTSVIAQVVEQLNPRLYIDFIRYLPPEVCLKILGYLDPVSLISVARSCRAWYELALDWKLWEQLYYMEGWKAKEAEIEAWEQKINGDDSQEQDSSTQESHRDAKHASSSLPVPDDDVDMVMEDVGAPVKQEAVDSEMTESSIFGDPSFSKPSFPEKRGLDSRRMQYELRMEVKDNGKGKGKAISPEPQTGSRNARKFTPSSGLPRSALWMWDPATKRHKINWRYLYTLRRRLESNWELGKFTNFQLPHPDHPEEGHGECIYSLQYNEQYLVSGSRDRSLKVWDLETRRCLRTLTKHRGSVLCLQFDSDPEEDIIVSGSSDSDVIIWRFSTGAEIQTLRTAHRESVLNVKFDKRILVTCSKDKTIKIFNRRPLRYGDLGYQEVDPVPKTVKNYGYSLTMSPEDLPQTPAWTMIGCLEGHGAAVNAVQIHGREVVSASGDRHIKVWDWPTQSCTRTIVGHTKGIACVQYDGRRIVSGSSDNEVKVFDRQTGLEVASLRSHSNLVRTVQAGFGDLPYSVEDDAAEAKRVDIEYFKALESGRLSDQDRPRPKGRRPGNAGSRRPEDICAYGAKLPPGGGGGKYGRIVSGSYDTSIIIWRRDKEGIWKAQHHLKQEEAAVAAMRQSRSQRVTSASHLGAIPLHPSVQDGIQTAGPSSSARMMGGATAGTSAAGQADSVTSVSPRMQPLTLPPPTGGSTMSTLPPPNVVLPGITQLESPSYPNLTPAAIQHYQQIIDNTVPLGPQPLSQALSTHPAMLTQRQYLELVIDRQPNPVIRSQLRQTLQAALIRAQFEQTRQRRDRNQEAAASGSGAAAAPGQAQQGAAGPSRQASTSRAAPHATTAQMAAAAAAAAAHQAHAHLSSPAQGVHLHQVSAPSSSVQTAQAPPQHVAHRHVTPVPAVDGHDAANPARVFKLQYDARRIICCSQTSVIVGWDFCNGDPELEEASRFFGHVQ
ncbi:F-box/WD repeat-containing protein 1A [Echria macrotheca]|uniref:F-box/WD repeat-containing protein 1A n=1 Tax=Echria macrotheca TaxID=438768 RepID=A0AAJ0F9I7_9PEZI|nr:F-box/WD repeat-containing protein 1A [Echria macrotheca]